ncbi:---NA--- : [Gemmataceae bacterium]|nr:---NA--- : [Gemmataceae bacterium]VTT99065.1 ---NA--- : [Gemmataceae bacterium]
MTAPDAAELVTNYWHFALKRANRFAARFPHLAGEFESAAIAELWRSATIYDPARCPRFATHLAPRLRWAFIRVLRSEMSQSPNSFAAQWSPTPKSDTHPLDAAPGRFPDPADVVERLDLAPLLATLPPDRADAVVRTIGYGETHESVAASRGLSRARTGQIIEQSLCALRTAAGVE